MCRLQHAIPKEMLYGKTQERKTFEILSHNLCEDTFSMNYELEVHILNVHAESYIFSCKHCNKNERRCHYFNHDQECPFEKIGYQFSHKVGTKFVFSCEKTKCRYQQIASSSRKF